jgi:hypothetical protein
LLPTALRVTRTVALLASLLTALVVAALPGTTKAASQPGPPRLAAAALPPRPSTPSILLEGSPSQILATLAPPAPAAQQAPDATTAPGAVPVSYFDGATVVSLYGHPGVVAMGELGAHSPDDAARLARQLAAEYDALNGPRGAIGALHLVVDVAQPHPGDDGTYLAQMSLDDIRPYVEVAREQGILLFLDLQIGWADPLKEVERLRPFLVQPFVHVALDPEFSTKSDGVAPGHVIGTLDAKPVNAVESYLAQIVRTYHLPPKILVLHQFLPSMLTHTADIEQIPEVEITVDMDGFGPPWPKISEYQDYAMASYAKRAAIKLFYHWDMPLMTPADVMALPKAPDYVVYQ